MLLVFTLSIFAATVCLYLGIYSFRLDPRSTANRVFFILSLHLAAWAFATGLLSVAPTKEAVAVIQRFSAFSWCFAAALIMHFTLILTGTQSLLRRRWVYVPLYLPGVIFSYGAVTAPFLAQDYVLMSWGWHGIAPVNSAWYLGFVLYYSICAVIVLSLTRQWGIRAQTRREQKQSKIIFWSALITIILIFCIETLLPLLGVLALPRIPAVMVLIWASGVWYAIAKYRLMILTPSIATDEIISRIKDLLFLVGTDGCIRRVNRQTTEVLGYREADLTGQPITGIMAREAAFENEWASISSTGEASGQVEVNCMTKNGEPIPLQITGSAVRDEVGDLLGIVFVAQDIRPKRQLEKEIAERKLAEAALRESETRYRTIFENTGTATMIIDEQATIILANTRAEELLGYSKDELETQKSLTDLAFEDDREMLSDYHRRQRDDLDPTPHNCEVRLVDRSGTKKNIFLTVALIPGSMQSVVSLLDITDQKRAEEIIRHLAYHDALTGLPNRKLFHERLAQELVRAKRRGEMLAVMFMDLNDFKDINDSYGHEVGDKLLCEVADRLKGIMRANDIACRLGGDEFTLLLTDINDPSDADAIARRILEAFKTPMIIDGRRHFVNISVGISLGFGEGFDGETLVRKADKAMYQAKKEGRSNYHFSA